MRFYRVDHCALPCLAATKETVEGFVALNQNDAFCIPSATSNAKMDLSCGKFAFPRNRLQLEVISAAFGMADNEVGCGDPRENCYDFNLTSTDAVRAK